MRWRGAIVDAPLSSTVLDGSPCDTALTSDQVSTFLGDATPGKPSDSELGPICNWSSNSGSGAGIAVSYRTKSDQGISLAYGFAFSTGLTLGDKATSEGKDSFDIAPQVADAVLTNVKARGGIR